MKRLAGNQAFHATICKFVAGLLRYVPCTVISIPPFTVIMQKYEQTFRCFFRLLLFPFFLLKLSRSICITLPTITATALIHVAMASVKKMTKKRMNKI